MWVCLQKWCVHPNIFSLLSDEHTHTHLLIPIIMWYNKRVLIAVSNIIGKHHKSIDKIVHMRPVWMCVCAFVYEHILYTMHTDTNQTHPINFRCDTRIQSAEKIRKQTETEAKPTATRKITRDCFNTNAVCINFYHPTVMHSTHGAVTCGLSWTLCNTVKPRYAKSVSLPKEVEGMGPRKCRHHNGL